MTRCNVCNFLCLKIDIIADHIPDLDNLISIAKSLMDLFWPLDPSNPPPANERLQCLTEKHGIERDVGAFCYTFSILLSLASDGNIVERKEELREISSRIVGILPSEEDTAFIANTTRTTCKQLWYALLAAERSLYVRLVEEALVSKLLALGAAIARGHDYDPRD